MAAIWSLPFLSQIFLASKLCERWDSLLTSMYKLLSMKVQWTGWKKVLIDYKAPIWGSFISTSLTRRAKAVRILHIWCFTTYIFSVHMKDLYPWWKLELWEMCRSSCVSWGSPINVGARVVCWWHLCSTYLSFVTVVWCFSASPALISCHISSLGIRFLPYLLRWPGYIFLKH